MRIKGRQTEEEGKIEQDWREVRESKEEQERNSEIGERGESRRSRRMIVRGEERRGEETLG